jgi:hypothetical protein
MHIQLWLVSSALDNVLAILGIFSFSQACDFVVVLLSGKRVMLSIDCSGLLEVLLNHLRLQGSETCFAVL